MMGFRLFSNPATPIAINFGSSSVKLLQVSPEQRPSLVAAAELPLSDEVQQSPDELFALYERELPRLLRQGKFKGKQIVFSVPAQQTVVQHMQIAQLDGAKLDDLVKSQLQVQMGIAPEAAVVRTIRVADLNRAGQSRTEVICFAIPRELVMRYVAMLGKFKLQVIGVHTEAMAMVRAFDHIHQRAGDEDLTTMYVDLGRSGTRVAIAHGTQMVFARSIQIGGRHFDQLIAKQIDCDLHSAMAHRLALTEVPLSTPQPHPQTSPTAGVAPTDDGGGMARIAAAMAKDAQPGEQPDGEKQSSVTVVAGERRTGNAPASLPLELHESSDAPVTPGHVDFSELLDTLSDELSMCLRYHHGLFPNRTIERAILVGGEARQPWLCQQVVRALRLPARLGDPLARLKSEQITETPGLDRSRPQPGWTVACGLTAMTSH